MKLKSVLGGLAAGVLLTGLVGVALGEVVSSTAPVPDDVGIVPPAGNGNLGAKHQTSSSALRAHLERADPKYLAGVNWATARSFQIPETDLRGWTFSQASGKRCLAIPDPLVEGYGITCKSSQEIAAGEATVVMLPPPSSGAPNIVGVLASEGGNARITGLKNDGQLRKVGDVFAGTAPAGSRLVTEAGSQTIDPPTDLPGPSAH